MCAGLTCFSRSSYRYFRGPYLEQLSRQDLAASPRDWKLLFVWPHPWAGYNIPEDAAMLQERVEENLIVFMVSLMPRLPQAFVMFGPLVRC